VSTTNTMPTGGAARSRSSAKTTLERPTRKSNPSGSAGSGGEVDIIAVPTASAWAARVSQRKRISQIRPTDSARSGEDIRAWRRA
jgi:hypothetical protein